MAKFVARVFGGGGSSSPAPQKAPTDTDTGADPAEQERLKRLGRAAFFAAGSSQGGQLGSGASTSRTAFLAQ